MWVDGVVRVVCGLSLNTSCQDVVIALAQAIGKSLNYDFTKLTESVHAAERRNTVGFGLYVSFPVTPPSGHTVSYDP